MSATDPENRPLTLRIISQARHGTVALSGEVATYIPEPNYVGPDSFTFAAWDGQLDSNLATVSIAVTRITARDFTISPTGQIVGVFRNSGSVWVSGAMGEEWRAISNTPWLNITKGAKGVGSGKVFYTVAANDSGSSRTGTITIAGQTFTIIQDDSEAGISGDWSVLTMANSNKECFGSFFVKNTGKVSTPYTRLATYLSNDSKLDSTDILLSEPVFSQISPGQSRSRPVKLTAPAGMTLEGKYLIAHVDADGIVPHRKGDDGTVVYGPLP